MYTDFKGTNPKFPQPCRVCQNCAGTRIDVMKEMEKAWAESDESDSAYKALCLAYHPDKHPGKEDLYTAVMMRLNNLRDPKNAAPVNDNKDPDEYVIYTNKRPEECSSTAQSFDDLKTFALCFELRDTFRRGATSFNDLNPSESKKHFTNTAREMTEIWSKISELANKTNRIRTGGDNEVKSFPKYEVKLVRVPKSRTRKRADEQDEEGDKKEEEVFADDDTTENKGPTACFILYFSFANSIDREEDRAAADELAQLGISWEKDTDMDGQPLGTNPLTNEPFEERMSVTAKRIKIKEKHNRAKANRTKTEDPLHALHWMMRANENAVDENDKGKATKIFNKATEKKRWVDRLTKIEFVRAMGAYCGSAERRLVNSFHIYDEFKSTGGVNRMNPYEACSIEEACSRAYDYGGDENYANPNAFRGLVAFGPKLKADENGHIPHIEQSNVFELSLGECVPDVFLRMRFPWLPDPIEEDEDVGVRDKIAKDLYDRELAERNGESYAIKIAKGQASRAMKFSKQRYRKGLTVERVAKQMTKWYKDELDPIINDYTHNPHSKEEELELREAAAAKKLEIQLRGMKLADEVLNPNGSVPLAIQNICRAYDDLIDKSPHKNFCMPLPKNFRNLTVLGNNLAHISICLEKLLGVATLHKECILATLCEYELYSGGKMHINMCLIGDAMTGKSYVIFYREQFSVEGTSMRIDALSEGVFKSDDTHDINYMIMRTEELAPSIVGANNASDKSGTAQTDKCASLRAILTSGKYGFSRLVKLTEHSDWTRVTADVAIQVSMTTAMNPPKNGQAGIPHNMRSRLLVISIQKREREGGSIQSRIVGSNPGGEKGDMIDKFKQRQVRDHCVMALYQFYMQMKILDWTSETVTDNFLVDFLEKLTKIGLASAADIRHFEKTRKLTATFSKLRNIWEYCDAETPGFKKVDQPWGYMDWIAMNKLACTSMEDLVAAVTFGGEQFEDPIMAGAVHALGRYFNLPGHQSNVPKGFSYTAELNEQKARMAKTLKMTEARHGKGKGKGKKPAVPEKPTAAAKPTAVATKTTVPEKPTAAATKTTVPAGPQTEWKDDGTIHVNGKETEASVALRTVNADLDATYYTFEWKDKHFRTTDEDRCDQLADKIYNLMKRKPAVNHLKGYLSGLTKEVTEDASKPGTMTPVLQFIETANNSQRVCIAKNLMDSAESNRLLGVLASMLDNANLPEIEYFTGIPETDTPWVFRTVIPETVRDARECKQIGMDLSKIHIGMSAPDGKDEKKEKRPKKPYFIRNHAFIDNVASSIVERSMAYRPPKNSDDLEPECKMHFSSPSFDAPRIELSSDFEDWGTFKFLASTQTTYPILQQLGFGSVGKKIDKLICRSSRYKLLEKDQRLKEQFDYPKCFPTRNPAYLRALKHKNQKRKASEIDPEGRAFIVPGVDPDDESKSAETLLIENQEYSTGIAEDTSKYRAAVNSEFRQTEVYRQHADTRAKKKRKLEANHKTLMNRGEHVTIQQTPIFGGTASWIKPKPKPAATQQARRGSQSESSESSRESKDSLAMDSDDDNDEEDQFGARLRRMDSMSILDPDENTRSGFPMQFPKQHKSKKISLWD